MNTNVKRIRFIQFIIAAVYLTVLFAIPVFAETQTENMLYKAAGNLIMVAGGVGVLFYIISKVQSFAQASELNLGEIFKSIVLVVIFIALIWVFSNIIKQRGGGLAGTMQNAANQAIDDISTIIN